MRVCIIGRGKVGRALHGALRHTTLESSLHSSARAPRAGARAATVYVLAVPDAQIRSVSLRIVNVLGPRDSVLHCSGNRSPEELDACRLAGAEVAAMHPMVSFASTRAAPELRGTTWIVRGDARAIRAARRIARALGAHAVTGPSGKPEYHAAAALLANGSAALASLAVRILETLGLDAEVAERAAAGMLRSVAGNVERLGVPAALTGPVVRGDADTVRSHVLALQKLKPAFAESYVALGPLILECARAAGLPAPEAKRIVSALQVPTRTLRSKSTRGPTRRG